MNLHLLKPKKALNKAFLKVKPVRAEIEVFKDNLIHLLDNSNDYESEEFHKNLVADFLKDTYYDKDYFINTKGRNDLVIHNGSKAKSPVGVILETKKPTNSGEMMSDKKPNTKALQELVLYYLRERITGKNLEVKKLIITNIYEWFIFDASVFERYFAQNKKLVKQFEDFENGSLSGTSTDFFYKEIAAPVIDNIEEEIECTYFDFREYEKPLRNADKKDDVKLVALFKLLSPEHLLKKPFTNDSNSLDSRFYAELLHIIGLSEQKQGGKKVIERNPEKDRNTGSILEDAIIQIDSMDKLSRLDRPSQFGKTQEERLFNVGLELSITWINRILFLKLLEAQLISYHEGDKSYAFLNYQRISSYDDLNSLFFQVLARKFDERNTDVQKAFENVPYLNSSLFEPTEIEHSALFISNLRDDKTLPIHERTVLKDAKGKRRTGELTTLEYLFDFLNAYEFSGEGSENIQEDNKTLINASVLGLIFEKINGYKDGSFFTPGFITMYMCRETIRKAVVQKFNEATNVLTKDNPTPPLEGGRGEDSSGANKYSSITDIYNAIGSRGEFSHQQANELINDIKICDPAVGSGHFLVSALNEMIAVKHDLGVLHDRQGKLLRDYDVHVENDELIITDYNGELFEYHPKNKESQRVQETLFHEKQSIIENCLFGVDINPNSVKICRLRLWIELLKNAYYISPADLRDNLPADSEAVGISPSRRGTKGEDIPQLQTLPNIDINIKCGNSLISRFDLDADLSKALRTSKWNMDSYRIAVQTYRNAKNKEQKHEMERLIADIKGDFKTNIDTPLKGKLSRIRGKVEKLATEINTKRQWNEKVPKKLFNDLDKATKSLNKVESERDNIQSNKIYENAFEWRFEFPEVLDDDGGFVGFDVVIGNPPWGASLSKEQKKFLKVKYNKIDSSTPNTFAYFIGLSFLISNSLITQILPDSLLVKDFSKTRGLCAKNLYKLSWYQNTSIPEIVRPFIDVEHDVCTIFINQKKETKEAKITTRFYQNQNVLENKWISEKSNFILEEYDNTYNILLNEKDINLLNKLRDYDVLDNYLQCHEGIHSGNIRGKLFFKNELEDLGKPMFLGGRGGDKIENYISYRSGWFVDYRQEVIDKNNNEYASLRDERIFNNPKIYLTRTGNPFKAFIDKSNYASNNFFSIQFKDYNDNSFDNLIPVLGLLNSRFSNYYIRKIIAPSLGNTFVETKIFHLLRLPFLKVLMKSKDFYTAINTLIKSKEKNENFESTSLEKEIDVLVYRLYGLTYEEVKIVDEDFWMSEEEYGNNNKLD